MERRSRAVRRSAGDLELVQGADATDLTPRYTQDASELDRAIKTQTIARLAPQGLDLTSVAHQYYATVLAVTGRERASLGEGERDALSKALTALGWRATEIALLCDGKPETLLSFAQALNAEALIILERDLLPKPPHHPWIKVAVCDDFFGSLHDESEKRRAWIQLQPARQAPALTD